MKYVLVELDRRLQARNIDYKHVGNIHDEMQMEVLEAHVDEVIEVTEQTFEDVGYMMGLRILCGILMLFQGLKVCCTG